MYRTPARVSRVLIGVFVCALASAALLAPRLAARAEDTNKGGKQETRPKRLLVVTVTKGFRHGDSIAVLEPILKELGEKGGGFTVDYVRDDADMAKKMTPEALKGYDGVLFGNTTGELPIPDKDAFLKWIAEGHAFIGTHAAADTYHDFRPYIDMIGGEFLTHGPQVEVILNIEDKAHPASKMLGNKRFVFDEIYLYKSYDRAKVHNLISMDKHPNTKEPGYYPVAWCKMYDKGRVFYTSLGHRPDVWKTGWYQLHLIGGIRWALGLEKGDASVPNPPSK
jgi:type 1 glutamine amidotransferase